MNKGRKEGMKQDYPFINTFLPASSSLFFGHLLSILYLLCLLFWPLLLLGLIEKYLQIVKCSIKNKFKFLGGFFFLNSLSTSRVILVVKNLPANARYIETWVLSLGQEDTLEKEMAAQSSIHGILGNPVDRRGWQVTVNGVSKSPTWLSN